MAFTASDVKTLRENEDYTIDYDTDKDKYFCSLNSKRKVKIKIQFP